MPDFGYLRPLHIALRAVVRQRLREVMGSLASPRSTCPMHNSPNVGPDLASCNFPGGKCRLQIFGITH